jgi:hypothetical protein
LFTRKKKNKLYIRLPFALPLSVPLPDDLELPVAGMAKFTLLAAAPTAQEKLTDTRHVAHAAYSLPP